MHPQFICCSCSRDSRAATRWNWPPVCFDTRERSRWPPPLVKGRNWGLYWRPETVSRFVASGLFHNLSCKRGWESCQIMNPKLATLAGSPSRGCWEVGRWCRMIYAIMAYLHYSREDFTVHQTARLMCHYKLSHTLNASSESDFSIKISAFIFILNSQSLPILSH